MSCCLASQSSRLILGSPRLVFFSLVPGPMYWYLASETQSPSCPTTSECRTQTLADVLLSWGCFLFSLSPCHSLDPLHVPIFPPFLQFLNLCLLGFETLSSLAFGTVPSFVVRFLAVYELGINSDFFKIPLVAPVKVAFFQPPLLLVDGLDGMGILRLFSPFQYPMWRVPSQ